LKFHYQRGLGFQKYHFPTVLSRDTQIKGYHENILRKDRNCFGGEVLVYISETLKVTNSLKKN
jgi:hypothetical protein